MALLVSPYMPDASDYEPSLKLALKHLNIPEIEECKISILATQNCCQWEHCIILWLCSSCVKGNIATAEPRGFGSRSVAIDLAKCTGPDCGITDTHRERGERRRDKRDSKYVFMRSRVEKTEPKSKIWESWEYRCRLNSSLFLLAGRKFL